MLGNRDPSRICRHGRPPSAASPAGSRRARPAGCEVTEFAAELSNQTVHAVMHLAWVDRGEGHYQGQMAVYVKPRGRLGRRYMTLIAPFRHWVVYPALMRQIERAWKTRVPQ